MANRIKGITVEIGGDTTGLDKALKGVNSTIKTTQTSLKDVNKLLKLDPTNTSLVTQKQKLLKEAVGATKEKLDALKTAQEQARQQLENGTLGQDKYDALQREIVETEEELRRLQQEAQTTSSVLSKIDETGKKFEKAGDAIAGAGRAVMPASAAVAGLGIAAVKTSADFDSAMSKVAAVSGATGKDFDALRNKAREMGSKTKFSASGEDLATTSDIVTDALTAFGLSAGDSGHFADLLAAASSNANTNVSMMAFLQNGVEIAYVQYNKMHINAIEAMDRLSVGAAADGGYFDFISTEYGMGVKWRAVNQPGGAALNMMRMMAKKAAEYEAVHDEDGVFKVDFGGEDR